MKQFLVITASLLLVGAIGWAIHNPEGFRHRLFGYSKEEKKQASEAYDRSVKDSIDRVNAQTFELEVELVTRRHGEAAGTTYRLCHTRPPTTEEHQQECERIKKQKMKDDAESAKHPW